MKDSLDRIWGLLYMEIRIRLYRGEDIASMKVSLYR